MVLVKQTRKNRQATVANLIYVVGGFDMYHSGSDHSCSDGETNQGVAPAEGRTFLLNDQNGRIYLFAS